MAILLNLVKNLTTLAQSTCQVGLRNFYKSAIINWKMTRTTCKLAQVFHIYLKSRLIKYSSNSRVSLNAV